MNKERYNWYKSQGICPQCRTTKVINRVICEECQKKNTKQKRERAIRFEQEGVCIICGKEKPESEKKICLKCKEKSATRKRQDRQARKLLGICTECGKQLAISGETLCLSCKMYKRETAKPKMLTPEQKAIKSEKDAKAYQNRKTSGACVNCGKRPQQHGLLCNKCYSTRLIRNQATSSDIARSERPAYGKCYICGAEELVEGKSVCSRCYDTRLNNIKKIMYWNKEQKNAKNFV